METLDVDSPVLADTGDAGFDALLPSPTLTVPPVAAAGAPGGVLPPVTTTLGTAGGAGGSGAPAASADATSGSRTPGNARSAVHKAKLRPLGTSTPQPHESPAAALPSPSQSKFRGERHLQPVQHTVNSSFAPPPSPITRVLTEDIAAKKCLTPLAHAQMRLFDDVEDPVEAEPEPSTKTPEVPPLRKPGLTLQPLAHVKPAGAKSPPDSLAPLHHIPASMST